jgi:hypothetical protein
MRFGARVRTRFSKKARTPRRKAGILGIGLGHAR